MDTRHSPDDILLALAETGRALSAARAERLAAEIAGHGGLDIAIAALAHDQAWEPLDDALAYGAALTERADPERLIARLLREACDLDARAEPAWAEAREFSGKADYRALQGEDDLARQYRARAMAAETLAAGCEDQAHAKRGQAARIGAQLSLATALIDLTTRAA
jgi:hypothetical protein